MEFASAYWSLLAAFVCLTFAITFEIRIAVRLKRQTSLPLIARLLDPERSSALRRGDALKWAAILAALQWFPLDQERLFGGTLLPDHITGAAVILMELLVGACMWLGTQPSRDAELN